LYTKTGEGDKREEARSLREKGTREKNGKKERRERGIGGE
jgi:hypothetical protein